MPSETELYPWIAESLPALEERFGRPKKVLGGGMFGQAFDMGDGLVVKVTDAPGEAAAAATVVTMINGGMRSEVLGLVYVEEPVLLGEYNDYVLSAKKLSPLWAIPKIKIVPFPIETIRAINRGNRMGRHKHFVDFSRERLQEGLKYGTIDAGMLGTPFEFASETAQEWVEAGKSKAKQRKLMYEYLGWVEKIRDIPDFGDVADSMENYADHTGIPLFDVRPENCGTTADGTVVCYDFMNPQSMKTSKPSMRPKLR